MSSNYLDLATNRITTSMFLQRKLCSKDEDHLVVHAHSTLEESRNHLREAVRLIEMEKERRAVARGRPTSSEGPRTQSTRAPRGRKPRKN